MPTQLELYYIGLKRSDAEYQEIIGNENRHSFGVRLFGKRADWDWNVECIYQIGTFHNLDINAWTVASVTGFTAYSLTWKPRFVLSANIASGDDDPNDNNLNIFNPLYPNLSYFEEAALLAPQNFFNINPSLSMQPLESIKLSVDWNFFGGFRKTMRFM